MNINVLVSSTIIESKNGSVKKVSADDSLFNKSWVKNDHVNFINNYLNLIFGGFSAIWPNCMAVAR